MKTATATACRKTAEAARSAARPEFSDADLEAMGYVAWRAVQDDWLAVMPMTFGKGRLCSGLTWSGYEDGWCYETLEQALKAMQAWNPQHEAEPSGWIRHPYSGRRRPNGDPTQEYVAR